MFEFEFELEVGEGEGDRVVWDCVKSCKLIATKVTKANVIKQIVVFVFFVSEEKEEEGIGTEDTMLIGFMGSMGFMAK